MLQELCNIWAYFWLFWYSCKKVIKAFTQAYIYYCMEFRDSRGLSVEREIQCFSYVIKTYNWIWVNADKNSSFLEACFVLIIWSLVYISRCCMYHADILDNRLWKNWAEKNHTFWNFFFVEATSVLQSSGLLGNGCRFFGTFFTKFCLVLFGLFNNWNGLGLLRQFCFVLFGHFNKKLNNLEGIEACDCQVNSYYHGEKLWRAS